MGTLKITCKDGSIRRMNFSNSVKYNLKGNKLTQDEVNKNLIKSANSVEPDNQKVEIIYN